jgi:hypothetical protein
MSKKELIARLKEILKDSSDMPYKEDWQKFDYIYNQIKLTIQDED